MALVARNLTDAVDGFLVGHRLLICDRDAKFTTRFRLMLEDAGVQLIRTPRQAPTCNAYTERFVFSIKSECLHGMIFFGESSLRRAIQIYVHHYHTERAHQGIGNAVIQREERVAEGEPRAARWSTQALLSGGVTMETLNRSAGVVEPRQPYLEWTRRDDAEGLAESVFETLREWFEVQMSSIVEDLNLGEALEYLQYWRSLC